MVAHRQPDSKLWPAVRVVIALAVGAIGTLALVLTWSFSSDFNIDRLANSRVEGAIWALPAVVGLVSAAWAVRQAGGFNGRPQGLSYRVALALAALSYAVWCVLAMYLAGR